MTAPHPILRLVAKDDKLVVGLMSGTSLDGIDAALVRIRGDGTRAEVTLRAFVTRAYDDGERRHLEALMHGDAAALCVGNFWLGERLAAAVEEVVRAAGLTLADVDLIGSHGQTIWHAPPSMRRGPDDGVGTLQLGEPAVIAARTGVVTVGDFRVGDVAVGGEGAPLVPWADWVLFRAAGRRRALQNIGGIANVAWVPDGGADEVLAFDNGPGNMMIDALAEVATGGAARWDTDGSWSARGRVQEDLLAQLCDDDYLRRPPPKSTGRERYGRAQTLAWAARHAERAPLDLLATLVAFTAEAIADSYRRFLPARPDEVLVSGGGWHNLTLRRELEARLGMPISALDSLGSGISVDAKEAVAFALLAVACVHAQPANLPRLSGATRRTVLGKLCLP